MLSVTQDEHGEFMIYDIAETKPGTNGGETGQLLVVKEITPRRSDFVFLFDAPHLI